ncbi:B3/B4 domain-containing protein [Eilatimonas milleporae]|uniref:DNA/RNA-binding domain of Phe-tRNA-synthetase-like protein n=1 Tax=Eilatimonas milleporae TaxID=911205 RepID=A0A3M0BZ62_9PROT|nr:phenylalanine--tRNA ligase beta subunit-related protein [Eilatimonas milleporae]RMB02778.1 DNA/RNA-binding domain of Phe-tRNA-synthetase-like protein [Eilatimonas milleporae]
MNITIDPGLSARGIPLHLAVLTYDVTVAPSPGLLVNTMDEAIRQRQEELMGEPASTDPVIAATRHAFKTFGKDPSRYRPSSEALTRRALTGKGIGPVNTVVDTGNIISLMTGLPVGAYDARWINGDVRCRIAGENETYDGIGRGAVNLGGLLVLSDADGPFGSPFSDSGRTAVTDTTENLAFVLYGLNVTEETVEAAAEFADSLISRFCVTEQGETQ